MVDHARQAGAPYPADSPTTLLAASLIALYVGTGLAAGSSAAAARSPNSRNACSAVGDPSSALVKLRAPKSGNASRPLSQAWSFSVCLAGAGRSQNPTVRSGGAFLCSAKVFAQRPEGWRGNHQTSPSELLRPGFPRVGGEVW